MRTLIQRALSRLPFGLLSRVRVWVDGRAVHARHRASDRNLAEAAARLSARCLSGVAAREDWEQRRPVALRQLRSMLGLDPLPERTPLQAQITGTGEYPAYRLEKILFESLPGLYVTANFYLPRNSAGPAPCVVYLNGHWHSLDGAKTGLQDRYLWYPAHGFALLVIDPVGFGEIPGVHPGTNRLDRWHWLSLGYTPAGVEVWNAMRALDWLETRSEVDSARIGVTGISGGGVMTQFLAALDERVAVAVPSCSTYTLGSQAAIGGLIVHQCDCTYYPNVFDLDFPEVLALIAPRPLLILGGRQDLIFPPAGFRAAFQRTRRIYDLLAESGKASDRIRLVESNQGHADPPLFLQAARQWMCQWLKMPNVSEAALQECGPEPEAPAILRCTREIPSRALNACIQDRWIQIPARRPYASPEAWARRRTELADSLRATTFAWFPQGEIPFQTRRRPGGGGYAEILCHFQECVFDSEPGVSVKASLLKPRDRTGPIPLVVWIRGRGEPVAFPDLDEFLPILRTHALAILTPRFSEKPLSGREYARIERTAALTGRSRVSLWAWDVRRTLDWAIRDRNVAPSSISVYGRGEAGIAALYAAFLDPKIDHVILRDPPPSHFEGAPLPMILRHTDIDEVAGALAPRRLTLLTRRKNEFELTRQLYQLQGAPEALRHVASLTEALREGPPGEGLRC